MISQKLSIAANGSLLGGSASYQLDTTTGILTYSLDVKVSMFFIPFPVSRQGAIQIDPARLLSSSVKVGEHVALGAFSLDVLQVQGGKATCSVKVYSADVHETGTAVLDLSGPYVKIEKLNSVGTVKGKDIPIYMEDAG